MQVYKGMNIGTGKISEEEKAGIPHYMLNIKQPNEAFSTAEYQSHVQNYVKEINQKEKLPIIVGGSGLYIQSVLFDYDFSNRKRNRLVTEQLENKLKKEGKEALYEELKRIDSE